MTQVTSLAKPEGLADLAFTQMEMAILDQGMPGPPKQKQRQPDLAFYVSRLACLGGYLDISRDPPPGNIVMWRGLTRLNNIALGIRIWRCPAGCRK